MTTPTTAGADVHESDVNGSTALMHAAYRGHGDAARSFR